MSKITPLVLGGITFKTKKALTEHIREIVKSNPLNAPFKNEVLLDLIKLHQHAERKIGIGIDFFTVTKHPNYKHKGLLLHRLDGSSTDFSWVKCITNPSIAYKVKQALRTEIRPQIDEFRNQTLHIKTCPITNESLNNNRHIDHYIPMFNDLALSWLKENNYAFEDIAITGSEDNRICIEMTDKTQKDSWIRYHKNNAVLRVISVSANLKRKRRLTDEHVSSN